MTRFSKQLTDNWQDTIMLILGVWLMASPWVLGFVGVPLAMWNAVLIGALIAVMALMAIVNFHEWEEWADIAIGLWLLVSPWVLGFAEPGMAVEAAAWNVVAAGILVIAMAVWSLMAHRQRLIV